MHWTEEDSKTQNFTVGANPSPWQVEPTTEDVFLVFSAQSVVSVPSIFSGLVTLAVCMSCHWVLRDVPVVLINKCAFLGLN